MLVATGITMYVGATVAMTGHIEAYRPWMIWLAFGITLVYAVYGWVRSIGVD